MKHSTEFDEIVVFGSRGHTMMILTGLNALWNGRVHVRAVIDDEQNGGTHPLLGVPVISSDDRLAHYPDLPVLVTPGSPALREKVISRLSQEGATLATTSMHGQPLVDPSVHFGAGAIVGPYTRLGPNVRIGTGAQILSTIIAHDVEIGDFSTVSVHSSVMGHVVIGKGVNVAPNAMIANGTRDRPLHIGDGAIIGVGAVIARDVPAGARMVGNPAMTVERWKALNRLLDEQADATH